MAIVGAAWVEAPGQSVLHFLARAVAPIPFYVPALETEHREVRAAVRGQLEHQEQLEISMATVSAAAPGGRTYQGWTERLRRSAETAFLGYTPDAIMLREEAWNARITERVWHDKLQYIRDIDATPTFVERMMERNEVGWIVAALREARRHVRRRIVAEREEATLLVRDREENERIQREEALHARSDRVAQRVAALVSNAGAPVDARNGEGARERTPAPTAGTPRARVGFRLREETADIAADPDEQAALERIERAEAGLEQTWLVQGELDGDIAQFLILMGSTAAVLRYIHTQPHLCQYLDVQWPVDIRTLGAAAPLQDVADAYYMPTRAALDTTRPPAEQQTAGDVWTVDARPWARLCADYTLGRDGRSTPLGVARPFPQQTPSPEILWLGGADPRTDVQHTLALVYGPDEAALISKVQHVPLFTYIGDLVQVAYAAPEVRRLIVERLVENSRGVGIDFAQEVRKVWPRFDFGQRFVDAPTATTVATLAFTLYYAHLSALTRIANTPSLSRALLYVDIGGASVGVRVGDVSDNTPMWWRQEIHARSAPEDPVAPAEEVPGEAVAVEEEEIEGEPGYGEVASEPDPETPRTPTPEPIDLADPTVVGTYTPEREVRRAQRRRHGRRPRYGELIHVADSAIYTLEALGFAPPRPGVRPVVPLSPAFWIDDAWAVEIMAMCRRAVVAVSEYMHTRTSVAQRRYVTLEDRSRQQQALQTFLDVYKSVCKRMIPLLRDQTLLRASLDAVADEPDSPLLSVMASYACVSAFYKMLLDEGVIANA